MKLKKILPILLLFLSMFIITGCDFNEVIDQIFPAGTATKLANVTSSTSTTSRTTKKGATTISEAPITKVITGDNTNISSVKLVSINDTHGQLVTDGYLMGLSQVEGTTKYLEEQDNQHYIRIMCGDLFQGSYVSRQTYGYCLIDALNAANYDCMVLGNHEFDWGLDVIEAYWDGDESNGEANFPLLCANLIDKRTGLRPDWVKPYMIINYYGISVGIIGAIGETLESTIATEYISDYEFTEELPIVKEYAAELKNKGCDVIIYASHSYVSETYELIANSITSSCPVDAFLAGHSHDSIEEYYKRSYDSYMIPLIQSYTKSRNFGTISINLNSDKKATSATFNHYLQNSSVVQNSSNDDAVETAVSKYMSIVNEGNEVLGLISRYRNGKQEVGDLLIQAMMKLTGANVGMANTGGIRVSSISTGNITFAEVYEAFPFDNKVVYFYMTGRKLKEYMNQRTGVVYNSDFDSSSIVDSEVYKFVTIDYCANYRNKDILKYTTDGKWYSTDEFEYNVVAEYIRKNSPIN